jgi:hypothetical protein
MGGEAGTGGEKGGGGPTELPFQQVRDEEWAEAINDKWKWKERGDIGWEKIATCPRCHHSVTFVDTAQVYTGFTAVRSISGTSVKYAACNCGVSHPGAPEGQIGCGANGLIDRPAGDQD